MRGTANFSARPSTCNTGVKTQAAVQLLFMGTELTVALKLCHVLHVFVGTIAPGGGEVSRVKKASFGAEMWAGGMIYPTDFFARNHRKVVSLRRSRVGRLHQPLSMPSVAAMCILVIIGSGL